MSDRPRSTDALVRVEAVDPGDVIPLRWRVLRAGFPRETAIFPGDEDVATTVHLAALDDPGQIVGVASIYREARAAGEGAPDTAPRRQWRLRGMAVQAEMQRSGIGRELMRACIDHVRDAGGTHLWCNARESVIGFYKREGFVVDGGVFDIPTVGPHVVMWRRVD